MVVFALEALVNSPNAFVYTGPMLVIDLLIIAIFVRVVLSAIDIKINNSRLSKFSLIVRIRQVLVYHTLLCIIATIWILIDIDSTGLLSNNNEYSKIPPETMAIGMAVYTVVITCINFYFYQAIKKWD